MKVQERERSAKMDKVYSNIKLRRKALGLSQEDLAKKVGYTDRSSIAKIETGAVDISLGTLKKLASALDTTVIELLGYLWKEE